MIPTHTHTQITLYSKDNGQHFGEHRIPAGKRQAYETDVLVPLLVRGPKQHITPGSSSSQLIQSVDLGPTFLHIAAASSSGSSSSPIVGDTNEGGSSNSSSSSSSSEYSIIDTTGPTMRASLLLEEKREKDYRQLYKTTYPMDGKSIVHVFLSASIDKSYLQQQQEHNANASNSNNKKKKKNSYAGNNRYNDFRWAALSEMYGGTSNIGKRYNNMTGYYKNHMVRTTLEMLRHHRIDTLFFSLVSPSRIHYPCIDCSSLTLFEWTSIRIRIKRFVLSMDQRINHGQQMKIYFTLNGVQENRNCII